MAGGELSVADPGPMVDAATLTEAAAVCPKRAVTTYLHDLRARHRRDETVDNAVISLPGRNRIRNHGRMTFELLTAECLGDGAMATLRATKSSCQIMNGCYACPPA